MKILTLITAWLITLSSLASDHPLKKVVLSYIALKDALVKADGSLAAARAKDLVAALQEVTDAQLPASAAGNWKKLKADLLFDAGHIEETTDIGHQRDHFVTLSVNMYALLKSAGAGQTIYYQHCPMANNGKGAYWLSLDSQVKNPYYGAQMLSCGTTKEVIR